MTQKQTAGISMVLIVGLLMMGGCDGGSSTNGSGMGQVMIQPPVSPFAAVLSDNDKLEADLTIDDSPTGIRMNNLPDGRVQATVPGVPIGPHTFKITYTAQSVSSRVTIFTAQGTSNVVAGTTTPVTPDTTSRAFDDDNDGVPNLDEVRFGTDARSEASRPTNATEVVAGGSHACALLFDTTLRCWGDNSYGQLGSNSTRSSLVAVPVRNAENTENLRGVTAVAVGGSHTCAVKDKQVLCWGDNSKGQLGNSTNSGLYSSSPVTVFLETNTPLDGVTAVAVGGSHTCAVKDKQVLCWGDNSKGQLGDGNFGSSSSSLVTVKSEVTKDPLNNVNKLAAGLNHTCALLTDETVQCWGHNASGQLGNDSFGDPSTNNSSLGAVTVVSEVTKASLNNVEALAAGGTHTCALGTDRKVRCWGANINYQLGHSSSTNSLPYAVPVFLDDSNTLLSGVALVSAGLNHTCALGTDRKVRCWGDNSKGQLGIGQATLKKNIPVESNIADVMDLSVGSEQTCALKPTGTGTLKPEGTVYCWGKQAAESVTAAVPVGGNITDDIDTAATSLALGTQHSCRRTTPTGTVQCWGDNSLGQLANTVNGQVANPGLSSSVPVTVVLNATNTTLDGVMAVASGSYHTCALIGGTDQSGRRVRCWGYNGAGQLGNNTVGTPSTDYQFPVTVVKDASGGELSGVTALVAGYGHTCALIEPGGTVQCWGFNSDGQLGNNSTTRSPLPVPVVGLSGVTALAAGLYHTCALIGGTDQSGGTVQCWGRNAAGQLGNNNDTIKFSFFR